MENAPQEKIGKVTLDYRFYPGEDFYSDGPVEDEMLLLLSLVLLLRKLHLIVSFYQSHLSYHR